MVHQVRSILTSRSSSGRIHPVRSSIRRQIFLDLESLDIIRIFQNVATVVADHTNMNLPIQAQAKGATRQTSAINRRESLIIEQPTLSFPTPSHFTDT